MNFRGVLTLGLALSLTTCAGESTLASSSGAGTAMPSGQVAKPDGGDSANCPLRAADLDKLTPYRWQFEEYKAGQSFAALGSVPVDVCQFTGKDDKGRPRAGVVVNIARDGNAAAFAKYWRAVCADSIVPERRGTVQPVGGVAGGQRCVTPNGSATDYWIESPGRTIHVDALDESGATLTKLLPQLLAAVAP